LGLAGSQTQAQLSFFCKTSLSLQKFKTIQESCKLIQMSTLQFDEIKQRQRAQWDASAPGWEEMGAEVHP
jgi:hypothetical protein